MAIRGNHVDMSSDSEVRDNMTGSSRVLVDSNVGWVRRTLIES